MNPAAEIVWHTGLRETLGAIPPDQRFALNIGGAWSEVLLPVQYNADYDAILIRDVDLGVEMLVAIESVRGVAGADLVVAARTRLRQAALAQAPPRPS